MREEYCEKVNGDIADDSAQHRREGKMLDVFEDLGHHRNESDRVCTNVMSGAQISKRNIPRVRTATSKAIPIANVLL